MRTNIPKSIESSPDVEDANAGPASKRNDDFPMSRRNLVGFGNLDPLDSAHTFLPKKSSWESSRIVPQTKQLPCVVDEDPLMEFWGQCG